VTELRRIAERLVGRLAHRHQHRTAIDTSVIGLWLGHEDGRSTQMYLHADLTLKERALASRVHGRDAPGATTIPTRVYSAGDCGRLIAANPHGRANGCGHGALLTQSLDNAYVVAHMGTPRWRLRRLRVT
jgi:hypothetical protein